MLAAMVVVALGGGLWWLARLWVEWQWFEQFGWVAGLNVVEAVDARDAVTDAQHAAHFGHLRIRAKIGDLILDNLGRFLRHECP
ncbi:hypothetical protein [Synechococcus sp. GFB01]|uniref:hypothetical protein n=1 Tax=Synechococcus sp. GFB01 TaxID=1662190 RepID=UPI001F2C7961|nr:hypothetical protein [Synechococcus sp. GFB01]